jgi:hypothetical protein
MTDLLLQDLEDLIIEVLVQILSEEEWAMLGDLKVPANKRTVHRSGFSSIAGSFTKVRKTRGKKCYNLKS